MTDTFYIVGNKYDYECFINLGICKTFESGKKVISDKVKKLLETKYKSDNIYQYVVNEWDEEDLQYENYVYAVSIVRHKIDKSFHDGFVDKIWEETLYLEKGKFLD